MIISYGLESPNWIVDVSSMTSYSDIILIFHRGFDPPVQSFIESGLTNAINRVVAIRDTLSKEDSDCMQRDFDLFLNVSISLPI